MEVTLRKAELKDSDALNMLWQFYQYHQSTFDIEDVGSDDRFSIDEEYIGCVIRGEEDCITYLIFVANQLVGFAAVETTEIGLLARKCLSWLIYLFCQNIEDKVMQNL